MNYKAITAKVKELRLQKGLSQEELAEKSGLSLRTVQRIENGETIPRGNSLLKLSEILGDLNEISNDQYQTKDKSVLMLTNLSTLSFLVFPFLGILVPLILWVSKRRTIQHLDNAGKTILNFQITWSIILCLSFLISVFRFVSMFTTNNFNGGIMVNNLATQELTIIVLYLYNIVFIILNSIRIEKGKELVYFPSIPFFRVDSKPL